MIKTFMTYDTNDSSLGLFFAVCAEKVSKFLSVANISNCKEFKGGSLNDLSVKLYTNQLNPAPFLFISFSHGSPTELLSDNKPFISTKINSDCLQNTFSFCFACGSGLKLGPLVCAKGCQCFIGYNKIIQIQRIPKAIDKFINCAVYGIECFLGGATTEESIAKMKENYTREVDEYYTEDPFSASILLDNRDALVIHGNLHLKLSDLEI